MEKMQYDVSYLKRAALELKIELTDNQIQQFIQYYELLIEWNSFMNLTAITDYQEVLMKHFIDSITILQYFHEKKDFKLIDIGTGAGFPGIPIKIMCPDAKITLLDSLDKRIKFLNEVISKLGLKKIEAIHGRAEDIARKDIYREKFDYAVSRAVANLASLSEYSLPFVKMNGQFISYKSEDIDEEVMSAKKAIYLLGGKLEEIVSFTLPESNIIRKFCIIEKIQKTNERYPRKAGLPTKEPLK